MSLVEANRRRAAACTLSVPEPLKKETQNVEIKKSQSEWIKARARVKLKKYIMFITKRMNCWLGYCLPLQKYND